MIESRDIGVVPGGALPKSGGGNQQLVDRDIRRKRGTSVAKQQDKGLAVKIQWEKVQLPEPNPTNNFVVQRMPSDDVVLTFSNIVMPFLRGTPQEQDEQLEEVVASGGLIPDLRARLLLSNKTARELHQVLGAQLDIHESPASGRVS